MKDKCKLHLGEKKVKKIQKHGVYYVGFNYMDDFTS